MNIVGVAACVAGIAHTYIAKKKLIQAGKLFEEVGILDNYDRTATISLLSANKEKIILNGGN